MDEGKEKERRMEEVQEQMTAKRILYRKKDSSWFGSDYNVNLYQGCPHGCIYCDSRSECYGWSIFHRCGQSGMRWICCKNSWHPAEKEVWWQPVQCPTHTIRWKKNKD